MRVATIHSLVGGARPNSASRAEARAAVAAAVRGESARSTSSTACARAAAGAGLAENHWPSPPRITVSSASPVRWVSAVASPGARERTVLSRIAAKPSGPRRASRSPVGRAEAGIVWSNPVLGTRKRTCAFSLVPGTGKSMKAVVVSRSTEETTCILIIRPAASAAVRSGSASGAAVSPTSARISATSAAVATGSAGWGEGCRIFHEGGRSSRWSVKTPLGQCAESAVALAGGMGKMRRSRRN